MSIKLKHSGGNSVSLNPPTSAPTSTEVAFKLPTSDGSAGQVLKTDGSGNLSWVSQPSASTALNMFDEYELPANEDLDGGVVITGWTSVASGNGTSQGTGMSVSSGVFTFPSTGKYLLYCNLTGKRLNDDSSYVGNKIEISTNSGSSYDILGEAFSNADSSNAHFQAIVSRYVDVTNVSTFRVRTKTVHPGGRVFRFFGDGNITYSNFQFMRLGDT